MRIETFNDLYDAMYFLETIIEESTDFLRAEIIKTEDGRYRVGVIEHGQLEFNI